MKRSILYSFVCMLLFGMTACVDDEIRPFDDIPEGETTVSMVVEFNPLTPALETRSVAGDAIKNIESLCVLVYDESGNLVERQCGILSGDEASVYDADGTLIKKKKINGFSRSSATWEGNQYAEKNTPKVNYQLQLAYGKYYIYAVANMGDLGDAKYKEAIKTVKGLKGISVDWNAKDVVANNQMLGHFTESDVVRDDSRLLVINKKGMSLRAGLRRLASKVTLAFDGSQLKEGVFIYLKSVEIKDIPNTCFLGDSNKLDTKSKLIEFGDSIVYHNGTNYDDTWPVRITKGRPYYPHNENYEKAFHSETEHSLFFYENMQGVHKDKNKKQSLNGVTLDDPGKKKEGEKGYKDDVYLGTYIEVKAYYVSQYPGKVEQGDIAYRFMLGKDVETDYNAERNNHYKLTLKFKNFANDVDWHIDYDKNDHPVQVPNKYYISYLYNKSLTFPVTVDLSGDEYKDWELESLEANIDTNSWAPYNTLPIFQYYRALDPFSSEFSGKLENYNGFLSLRKTKAKRISFDMSQFPQETPYYDKLKAATAENKRYYEDEKRGNRVYLLNETGTDEDGRYSVKQVGNVWHFEIPMYTRAKQLITETFYTGNNPYVAYQRKAVVSFTANLKKGGEKKQVKSYSDVMQVRRVVNPKGIWRSYNNPKSFHVVLKRLPRESATSFESFTSEGKWRAKVVSGDANFIYFNKVGQKEVEGSTGSLIDFTIGFNGPIKEHENRFAIVQVDYHDYTCQHLIFVRQGKAPVALVAGGSKWHACNMRTKTEEAASPVDEGSLFKFGNWDEPIDAWNNVNDVSTWTNPKPSDFLDHSKDSLLIAGTNGKKKVWKDILGKKVSSVFSNTSLGEKTHVATYEDYRLLYDSDVIENAFGVLYGDEADETKTTLEEVYKYCYAREGGYGMRGIFVYNSADGRHIFFPIGASGYGHRKAKKDNREKNGWEAVLRYSISRIEETKDNYIIFAPLMYDLYMRPGAIYWLREINKSNDALGWDFNYFTFDFNMISQGNIYGGSPVWGDRYNNTESDACFVRCVED